MSGRGHQDFPASEIIWKNGSEPGIQYTRFNMDAEEPTSPSIIMSRFGPGAEVPAHTHDSNYFEYIIEGSQTVGKQIFQAGDVRLVKGGTGYGPIKVGPDGCFVLIVFQNGSLANTIPMPREKPPALTPA